MLTVVLVFASFIHSCAQPKWFETRRVPGLSNDEFFIGFGMGSSLDDAVKQAQNELASQLTVTVKSETNLAKESYSVNEKALFVESFQQEIQTTVAKQLTNAQIEKTEKVGSDYYALVTMNKEDYFRVLKLELDKEQQQLSRLVTNFDRFIEAGRWPQAFERLREAYNKTGVFEEKKMYYQTVARRNYDKESPSPDQLRDKGTAVVQAMQLELVSGGNQAVFAGDLFPKPIVLKLSQLGNPVTGMSVDVLFADGEVIGRFESGAGGLITINEAVAKNAATDKQFITALVSPAGLPEFVRELLTEKQISIPFTLKPASEKTGNPVGFQLSVSSSTSTVVKQLESALIEKISQAIPAGFVVNSSDSKAKLKLTYTVAETKEVEGMQANLKVVKVAVQLKSENTSTAAFYTSPELTVSGLASTEDLALAEALKKLQIPSVEIAKLFRVFNQ